jgi:uncharacterized protein YukE
MLLKLYQLFNTCALGQWSEADADLNVAYLVACQPSGVLDFALLRFQFSKLSTVESRLKLHPTPEALMSQAVVDPEELRRFAAELKRFNADLQSRMVSLKSRFQQLGESWQDQEQLKYAQDFEAASKSLKTFMEQTERHVPLLLRKAERIDEYLNQR